VFVADYTPVACCDSGSSVYASRQMVMPGYQATLGFAFVSALGQKSAAL
jgi:hypothetical protein